MDSKNSPKLLRDFDPEGVLHRNNLKDVEIVTYNELFERFITKVTI